MNSRIFVFGIAAVVLFFICFFTARIYIYGFKITSHPARGIVATALILPIVYIGSLVGSRKAHGLGATGYTIVNIIAGIFFYLFLGAVTLGVISLGFLIGHHNVPIVIAWVVLILSLIVALGAFIQAKVIRTTHYTVKLKNAPAHWNGKTAALISDTHFGLVNYKKLANKVVNKILSLNPDFVLHAGDFYDGPIVDTTPITDIWKKLTAKVPLFYTPGNHEAYGDYTMFVDSVRAAGATVLDDKIVEYDGIQIVGTLYRNGKEHPEIATTLAGFGINKNTPTILINHPPTAFTAPAEHNIDLIVSGHTHRGQFWPLRYITHKVYGDYDYRAHPYHEDLVSITSNGIGTYGPPMRLFNSPEVVIIHFTI